MNEVVPFLENVLRGRNVPRERMLQVAHHYEIFDGVSPINEQNRNLIDALQVELDSNGPKLPIYWGNRNWHPLLADTVQQMANDGIKRALAFVTAAYSSYSSCRQYLQNIADAQSSVGSSAPQIEKLRVFYNHPLFLEANVEHVRALMHRPFENPQSVKLIFTAHSIPESMAATSDYASQLEEAGSLIAGDLGISDWKLVYQSRSGSPQQPWLGPDICDFLKQVSSEGISEVIVAPIGFVSDHMEVIYDLDVEAKQLANALGMTIARAATAGTNPKFVQMIRELILERTENAPARFRGSQGARSSICSPTCCQPTTIARPSYS